ncbi:dihydrofolate reductase family protein [Nonomuraea cavernae]|uniref:Deaminase reductase n=1 Tax=Nonomuraea cavernae TaxID=2045107 RepID=A0A917YSX7_9ACTN|nr:dihydrofolate reductase family protein [Nonomuraea cavernae]MCA2184374.1 dihydrofolate reductase family protein [Nonomuraea cavernae]GGO63987.1 deaminase reductase [Nonomuraea cavernae]
MGEVVLNMTVSVDGFATGPGGDLGRLHEWIFSEAEADLEVSGEFAREPGAYVMGMGMFRAGLEPWGEAPPFPWPVFVLSHQQREPLVKPPATFTFVTDGVASAVERARAAAGDRDVWVVGGVDVCRQALAAGLVGELRLHVAHVLLGEGLPLFGDGRAPVELEVVRTLVTPAMTHQTFRVVT